MIRSVSSPARGPIGASTLMISGSRLRCRPRALIAEKLSASNGTIATIVV